MNPTTIVSQRFQTASIAAPTTSSNILSEFHCVPLEMNPKINNNNNPIESVIEATGGLPYPVVGTTISLTTPLPAVAPGSILAVIPAALIPAPAMAFQLSSNGVGAGGDLQSDNVLRTAAMHPIIISTSADGSDANGGVGGAIALEPATIARNNSVVVGAENGDAGEVNLAATTTIPVTLAHGSHVNPVAASAAAAAIMQAGSGNTSSILLCNQPTFGTTKETKANPKPQTLDKELLKQIVVGNTSAPPKQLPPPKQQLKQQEKPSKKLLKNHIVQQPTTSLLAPAITYSSSQLNSATYADLYNSRLSLPAGSELSKTRRPTGNNIEKPQNNCLTLIKKLPTKPAIASAFTTTVGLPKKATNKNKFPITEPLSVISAGKLLTNPIMTPDTAIATVVSLPDITITTSTVVVAPTAVTAGTATSTAVTSGTVPSTAFNCTPSNSIAANDGVVVVEDDDELSSHKVIAFMNTKAIEKQESLLKSTPKPKNIISVETTTSPRSKQRAASLNLAPAVEVEDVANIERRHSHPTDILEQATKCTFDAKLQQDEEETDSDYEEVDLIAVDQDYMDSLENTSNSIAPDRHELKKCEQAQTKNKPKQEGQQNVNESNAVNETIVLKNNTAIDQHQEDMKSPIKIENTNATASVNTKDTNIKIEPINIDDDCEILLMPSSNSKENSVDNQSNSSHATNLDKSLLCDEKIALSTSSSTSVSSSNNSSTLSAPHAVHAQTQVKPKIHLKPQSQLLKAQSKKSSLSLSTAFSSDIPVAPNNSPDDSFGTVVTMLSAFNMLRWKERCGTARSTNMCFVLNDFNLIQLHERCPTRNNIHTAYEKPLSERLQLPKVPNQPDPLLYICKRCNCFGPAADFLAPNFCSLACLKRACLKRQREASYSFSSMNSMRKRSRKEPPTFSSNNNNLMQLTQNRTANPSTYKRVFRWSTYMTAKCEAIGAPVDLFLNPFPTDRNRFTIGMKLEAIDPANCSLFCVATVVDIQGYRLKLNLDGYCYMYDFWVNADSMDIFPPGWCTKTNRILQPPKGTEIHLFNWSKYVNEKKAPPANRVLFTHLNSSSSTSQNPFKISMHLEAEDLNDTGKLCVATVADILDNRIRVHFDGWAECYDYWVDINSPYIHPCGWHQGRRKLFVPPGLENARFTWPDYIKCKRTGIAAPADIFAPRNPINFKPGMKLEVVDPRNPSLIRPATINSCNGHRVKLHLDGWASDYCFWLEDDSPDLHPIGWCDATGHELEPPPGYKMRPIVQVCHINGCRGIGNAKEFYLNSHSSPDCCPYEPSNWSKKVEKPKRIEPDDHHMRAVPRTTKTAPKLKAHQLKRGKQASDALAAMTNVAPMQFAANALREQSSQHSLSAESMSIHKNERNSAVARKNVLETIECIDDDDDDIPSCSTKSRTSNANSTSTSSSSSASSTSKVNETEIKIAKEYLNDYGPRLQQNFNIWIKNSNSSFDIEQIQQNPVSWSTKETCAFIERVLNSHTIAMSFQQHDIDGEAFLSLQQSDLTDILKMKLGPAVKLYTWILRLRTLVVRKFGIKLHKLAC